MTTPPPALDAVGAAIDRGLHQLAALGGDLVEHANRIGTILWSPPRIVVVGRIKGGKSTLVNALIGAPVADTGALETTNVVTVYQYGAPARADAVALDGTRRTLPVDRNRPAGLDPATVAEIAYVHRYLPSRAIADLTLVDTPGLATLTEANENATRRVLIDGFEQTRTASVDADAAVFLFDAAPRADEVDFLRQIGFTPLNTLGVLSRADGFGAGVLGDVDPITHAHSHARTLADRLSDAVMTVVPIAGLLAETSHTGQLTENDARALATLGGIDPLDLIEILEADDPAPLTPQMRDRLLDLIGEYGVVGGRDAATGGAHRLGAWLTERSGIDVLRTVLHDSIREFASIHRAYRILTDIDNLAYQHPAGDHIRTVAHTIRLDPAITPVLLFRSLRGMLEADPRSPVVDRLIQVLRGRTPAERVGLPTGAPTGDIADAIHHHLGWVHQQAIATMSAAEDAALADLLAAYNLMLPR